MHKRSPKKPVTLQSHNNRNWRCIEYRKFIAYDIFISLKISLETLQSVVRVIIANETRKNGAFDKVEVRYKSYLTVYV
jgi:hypothetical protein